MLKTLIKKYFSSFVFFYRYLRNKIFIAFFLSVGVSVLDGLGLTMFFPLLQVVGGDGKANAKDMGQLGFIVDGLEKMGITLTVGAVLLTMIFFFILKGGVVFLSRLYQVILLQGFIRKIRLRLLDSLNQMSFKRFITSDVGRIQNTLTGEVNKISGAFTTYMATFQQAVMVLVYISFAFLANVEFALLVSAGGILTNFLYRIIYGKTKEASRRLTKFDSKFQGQVIQHVRNFKYLKSTGSVSRYGAKLRDTVFKIETSRRRIGFLSAITSAAREPMLVIIIAVIIYIQVRFFHGAMGTIIISLLFFYRALTSLMGLQESWNGFMGLAGSLENMVDFQDLLDGAKEKDGKIEFNHFNQHIRIRQVDFFYGETQILKNIDIDIPKNKSVAFVGESGSGKTTLVNLIAGLLPETKGQIFIDEEPLRTLKKETYQSKIGYVSQEAVIFNDTIYNNVTFWAPKNEKNIARFEESMKRASIADFLNELPKRENTELGNNGINLSGGQKQRISIARELYKEIEILILDEATSALDSQTEREIQTAIDNLNGEYTIIIIAHRLSTIRNVDEVIFMDRGKIIDRGSFEDLVAKQERFKKMVELQEL